MERELLTNITFTKNRPLQLDGYLRSLHRFFPSEWMQMFVIYKEELFDGEYESVFRQFPDIEVIRESSLHRDTLAVLDRVDTEYVLFGIDDVAFFDGLPWELVEKTFAEAGDDIFGFTLRFGPETVRQDGDAIDEVLIGNETVYRLRWANGQTKHTRYPFELCSTVYRTCLVRDIVQRTMSSSALAKRLFSPDSGLVRAWSRVVSPRSLLKKFGFFYSPNTFESWVCRWCQTHSDELPGFTYFQKVCATAIQVNMVNTSTRNAHWGTDEHTVEALNERYKEGYRLDIDFVGAGEKPGSGSGPEVFRLVRAAGRETHDGADGGEPAKDRGLPA